MLWLALHLPLLCLEIHDRGQAGDHVPLGMLDEQRLIAVNPAARDAGVRAGMRPAEAASLCAGLKLIPRDPRAELDALKRLGDWGLQYSARVSLQPPDGLLLEIGGSLRLFGGLEGLLGCIGKSLSDLGYRIRRGIAPTPTAAWLLAQAGSQEPIRDPAQLRRHLAALPAVLLAAERQQREALYGLGLRTVGDCLALPRADLGRRVGGELLHLLERALGERPDPRRGHRPATEFHAELPLPAEARNVEAILFSLRRLLRELCGLLRSRVCGVQELTLRLDHERQPATDIPLTLQGPCRDPEQLLTVARERLARQPLAAAVTAVSLHARYLLPLPANPMELLDTATQRDAQQWRLLAERLDARLGENRVLGLSTRAEHRPERAWQAQRPGTAVAGQAHPHRPLWLLPQPRPLELHRGHPCWNGPLALEASPERIETGWWDGDDISRDYHLARAPDGALLWIYRDRRPPHGWFLHGLFG